MKTLTFGKILVGTVLTAAAAAPSFATNLLTNPGFETGDFTGWAVGGPAASGVATSGTAVAAYFPGSVNVLSGNYAAYGVVRGYCCTSPEAITLTQTLNVAPFQTLNIGFSASNWSNSIVGAQQMDATNGIEIYVNGTAILPNAAFFNFNNDQSWYGFSGTYANGATTAITIEYQFVASGTGNFPVSLDDFYVEGAAAVPEPSSLLLAAVGVLGLGIRRRRT